MREVHRVILGLALVLLGQGAACPSPKVFRLTAEHGTIMTPNFPAKFRTPLCYHWIIDSGEPQGGNPVTNGKTIRIFLTQAFLKQNFTIVEYVNYVFPPVYYHNATEDNMVRKGSMSVKARFQQGDFYSPLSHITTEKVVTVNETIRSCSTTYRYFGIQVELYSQFATHFRARNFLNVYGFNITYEIVDEKNGGSNVKDTCSIKNCSAAGSCYVSKDYRDFFCDCLPGRSGKSCQYSERCNPKLNTTFCLNGGKCRSQASGVGICSCPEGFTGQLCQIKTEAPVIECPGKDCEETCDNIGLTESLHRPCSCHTGRIIPKGWMRYEGTLQSYDHTLPVWDSRSRAHSIDEQTLRLKTRIEQGLTEKLKKIPGFVDDKNSTSVTVVSFEEASKFTFQFFGPNNTIDPNTLRSKLTAGNGILFPTFRIQDSLEEFMSYPALALKELSKRGPNPNILKFGDDFSITCVAEGSRRVSFKWFKDGVPINPSLAIRQIHENQHRQDNLYLSTSILMFDSATSSDRGVFTCQVSDMGEEQCKNLTVALVSLPIIEVEPMSLTLQKGEIEKIITCTTENESRRDNFSYTWERNEELLQAKHTNEVIEPLEPYGSLLRIVKAESSARYTCIVANNAGESKTHVDVQVLESRTSPACRAEYDKFHLGWDLTGPGQIAKRPCPAGYVGFVQRACQPGHQHGKISRPKWGYSDFSRCLSNQLKFINKTVQSLKMGFANKTQLSTVTRVLHAHLMARDFLYTGEGEKIISLLKEIGSYALKKRNVVVGDKFLQTFFNTTTRLLKFPGSCMYGPSVILLSNLIHEMATQFSNASSPALFHSEVLVMERLQMGWNPSLVFPLKPQDWISLRLEIPNQDKMKHMNEAASFLFIVFKNLTGLISDKVPTLTDLGHPVQLVSPLASFTTTKNYKPGPSTIFTLTFDLSTNIVQRIRSKELNITCAGYSDVENKLDPWQFNACSVSEIINNRSVECSCMSFGQYAVLVFDIEKPVEIPDLSLHWSVVAGSVTCILCCTMALVSILLHIHCQVRSSSLYTLKLLVCTSLILSILFILSIRSDTSSVALSTCLSSLLLLSLSCHLTKSLHVLLSTQMELFPWLQSVPLITLLLGFFVMSALPVWTAAAVLSHTRHRLSTISAMPESSGPVAVLSDASPVFGTFVASIVLTVLAFLIIFYKASFRLRIIRVKMDSGKIQILDYRMKTLNRALMITLSTLITILAALLHNNIPNVLAYQYFFGLATFTTGMVVFFSYTVKSEHPIPGWLTRCFCAGSRRADAHDPEIPALPNADLRATLQSSRTPEKRYENGQVSSILLSQPQNCHHDHDLPHQEHSRRRTLTFDSQNSQQSEPETTMETLGGSSINSNSTRHDSFAARAGSISSTERAGQDKRSTSFNRIPRSCTNTSNLSNPPDMPWMHQNQPNVKIPHSCPGCCRKNSRSSSTHRACSDIPKPQRARCLLFEAQNSEYVMPSSGTDGPSLAHSTASQANPNTTSSPAQATDLDSAYMNANKGPSLPSTTNKKPSPTYPDVRELTRFMTFHPQEEAQSSLGRPDLPTEIHRNGYNTGLPAEAVYESIKGSRSTSLSNIREDEKSDVDPEPPELPATTFSRGKIPDCHKSINSLPIPVPQRNGPSTMNGLNSSSSSSSLISAAEKLKNLNKTEEESLVTMMIPLTELQTPETVSTKASSTSSSLHKSQPKLDQLADSNVLGKIHRDLDYLLERKDQDKLSSSENLKL